MRRELDHLDSPSYEVKEKRKLNFMLRRVLPEWDFDRMLTELVHYCPKNSINEVIFMVNPEEFSEGILPLSRVKQYADLLTIARERLQTVDVKMSVNVWATLYHMDRGRDIRSLFPDWTWMVDQNGRESAATPCPLSEGWIRHIARTYALYASSRPHILWVDDDFRYHNHLPLDWGGCFCDLHLKALSDIMNRSYSREEALAAIVAKGEPKPERIAWLKIMGQSMINVAKAIEQAVHEVSPETKIGLMTSLAANHSAEGRPWHELLHALAGHHRPVARPHYGPYADGTPRDFAVGFLAMRETSSCYPTGTIICPEIENIPFTIYSKSASETALQISTCIAAGMSNITLDLYDFVGNSSDLEPAYSKMFKQQRAFWDAVSRHCPAGGIERGVGVLRSDNLSAFIHTSEGKSYSELVESTLDGLSSLTLLGLPLCYDTRPVNIGFGQVWRSLNPRRIERLLAGGVILDGIAARTLAEMGYSHLIGVETDGTFSNLDTAVTCEKIIEPAFKHPISNGMMTTTYGYWEPCLFERLVCLENALVVSVFLNQYRDRLWPATVLYENEIGGRIVTIAMHHSGGIRQAGFRNWDRKAELEALVKWAGRGDCDMFVRGCGPVIPYGRDLPDHLILCIACLQPDGISDIEILLAQDFQNTLSQPYRVSANGLLEPDSGKLQSYDGHLIFRPSGDLKYLEVGVWILKKEKQCEDD